MRSVSALSDSVMHYVVSLNLDPGAEEQIRSLWRCLADHGLSPRELASDGTPHVTAMSSAPFPLSNIAKDFASLVGQYGPFDITFSHFGIFPERPLVLFLGVTHTAMLMSLHRQLYDLIAPTAAVFEFARPDAFVFHCTLGYLSQPSDLPRAVELVTGAPLPRKARVKGFDVVECTETTSRRLAAYAFGGGGAE